MQRMRWSRDAAASRAAQIVLHDRRARLLPVHLRRVRRHGPLESAGCIGRVAVITCNRWRTASILGQPKPNPRRWIG